MDWDGIGLDGPLKKLTALINLKLNVSIVEDREDPIDVVKDV